MLLFWNLRTLPRFSHKCCVLLLFTHCTNIVVSLPRCLPCHSNDCLMMNAYCSLGNPVQKFPCLSWFVAHDVFAWRVLLIALLCDWCNSIFVLMRNLVDKHECWCCWNPVIFFQKSCFYVAWTLAVVVAHVAWYISMPCCCDCLIETGLFDVVSMSHEVWSCQTMLKP